jgi:thioredoxin reductase
LVENYPDYYLSGAELAEKIEQHARAYDLVTIKEEKALSVSKEKLFVVKTEQGEYRGKAICLQPGQSGESSMFQAVWNLRIEELHIAHFVTRRFSRGRLLQ